MKPAWRRPCREAIETCERKPNVPSALASKRKRVGLAQPRKRTRLVPRRLTLPSNLGASGRPDTTPCSSPRLPPGMPNRSSSICSLSSVRARDKAQVADGLAARHCPDRWRSKRASGPPPAAGRARRSASGTMLSSGPAVSLTPAMRSRSSQREDRLISTASALRHCALISPVMSCGRPPCSKARARSERVAPAGSAWRMAFRSKAGSPSADRLGSALRALLRSAPEAGDRELRGQLAGNVAACPSGRPGDRRACSWSSHSLPAGLP